MTELTTKTDDYDVVILGMGPVGSMAAILLAHAGLRVVTIDRDEAVYQLPRAVNLDGELVRAMQPTGHAEDLAALLQPVRAGERVGFANSKREFLFGNRVSDFGVNGWQPLNMFDQPELEGYLRTTAAAYGNVDTRLGFEATGFEDDGAGVTVTIARDGATTALRGRYLIAADGASSSTRRQLGIGWHDLGYNHDWLVVDVITRPGHTLDTTTLQVCDPDRISTYVCTKDPYRRWEFKLNPGETWEEMLEPAKIRELIETWTPAGTYEIRRAAMYQFHAATADTWRIGNVFLAGDAAHQTPPFLGQGMNAGLRDVVNLAWKLPMVLNGTAGEGLLDSYQSEREAHAHDLVEWAVSIGQLMEHLAEVERAERSGEAPPPEPGRLQSSGYGQGREQPPLRDGVVLSGQIGVDPALGALFSQPIVKRDSADDSFRLDEQLGPGFAIVGRDADALAVDEKSQAVARTLGLTFVDLSTLSTVRGHFDRGFETLDAIVVRPDRYVFGGSNAEWPLDAVIAALGEALHLQ